MPSPRACSRPRRPPRLGAALACAVLTALLVLGPLPAPPSARACWDGYSATYGAVTATGPDDRWDPKMAAQALRWLARIDALVPDGTRVEIDQGYIGVCTGGVPAEGTGEDCDYDDVARPLPEAFRALAARFGASAVEARAALALPAPRLYTVQAGAFEDEAQAQRQAERIDAAEVTEHGAYEAGGFPAWNPTAHVLEGERADGRPVFRVVVGLFTDRAEAEAQRRALEGAGLTAFARAL